MTSKISFFKLLKEDMKQRSWLAAIIALVLLISQPVYLLMRMGSGIEDVKAGYIKLADLKVQYGNYIALGEQSILVLIVLFAVVSGISGFAYLHSRVQLDFYHSLAIKRQKKFWVQYVSGVLMTAIPYLVTTLLCLAAGGAYGLVDGAMVGAALHAYLFRMLSFLAVYAVAILATVLTGRLLVAILGVGVFVTYSFIVVATFDLLCSVFFSTYMGSGISSRMASYFSPPLLAFVLEKNLGMLRLTPASTDSLRAVINIVILIVETVVITGLAILAHTHRKSEAAGSAMAFKKSESVVKFLVVVPISVLVGVGLRGAVAHAAEVWMFGGTVVCALVLSGVIEFIYHTNMREIFARKLQILITTVVSLIIILVFLLDIPGYDTYLPTKDSIAKMAVNENSISNNFVYYNFDSGSFNYGSSKENLDRALTAEFDAIYALAKAGVEHVETGIDSREENRTDNIAVEYQLKNGRRVYRSYRVGIDEILQHINDVFESEGYRQALFPVFTKDSALIQQINYEDGTGAHLLDLNQKEKAEFVEIYKKELEKVTYNDIADDLALTLTLSYTYDLTSSSYSSDDRYPICKSFTNTLAYIEEKQGKAPMTDLDIGQIEEISIERYNLVSGEFDSVSITTVEELQEVVPLLGLRYSYLYPEVDSENMEFTIWITFNNGSSMYDYRLKNGAVLPDSIQRKFEK